MKSIKKLRILIFVVLILMISGLVFGFVSVENGSKATDYFGKYLDAELDSDIEDYYLEKSDYYSDLEDSFQTMNVIVVYAILGLIIATFIWVMIAKEIK